MDSDDATTLDLMVIHSCAKKTEKIKRKRSMCKKEWLQKISVFSHVILLHDLNFLLKLDIVR